MILMPEEPKVRMRGSKILVPKVEWMRHEIGSGGIYQLKAVDSPGFPLNIDGTFKGELAFWFHSTYTYRGY